MNIRADSNSPDQTWEIGKMIGQSLLGREIILLCGELGAGKTLLTKGIAAGLAIDPDLVVSPTFTLLNRYDGRFPLFHIDLYRIKKTEEAFDIGIEEYISGDYYCFIEWPGIISDLLPERTMNVIISVGENEERILQIS